MEVIESLVDRARAGEVPMAERLAAFGQIVLRYQDMAYGCAYAMLGDFHLAQDAAQEAFLTAYSRLPQLRKPLAFGGWLRRIVISQCNRMKREQPRVAERPVREDLPSRDPTPPEQLQRQEMADQVLEAVQALPPAQRMVTTLFYINGYAQKDIAEFLELPLTTIKKRLVSSRQNLKRKVLTMVDKTLKSFPLKADFADVVVRQAADMHEVQQAAGLLDYSARKRAGDFESPADAEKAGIYVVGKQGKVQGAGYYNETQFAIGSTILRAARPAEIGQEGQGVPSPAFFNGVLGAFKLAAEKGIHLAVVHGSMFDHAFCGFVPCFYYPLVKLPCERATSIKTAATLRLANTEEEQAAKKAWLLDPYAPKLSAFIGGGQIHTIRLSGLVVGYARVNSAFDSRKQYGMAFGYISDVTARNRPAMLAVIRKGAEFAQAAGEPDFCLMQSHMTMITQTMLSLGGTYLLRPACDVVGLDAEMVAIIDLPGLTHDLHGELDNRLAISGARDQEAALSIEMAGQTVAFIAKRGQLKLGDSKQHVHRKLPRWVVTRLYTGYYSSEDVLNMGPLPCDRSDGLTPDDPRSDNMVLELPEAEASLFCSLFPKLWPVSWPDPDVWPWVIGKEHPKYQHEKGKSADTKAQIDALRWPWIGR